MERPAAIADPEASTSAGVVDWEITIDPVPGGKIVASAKDAAGNLEQTGHEIAVVVGHAPVAAR